jgi:hypothetical protein
MVEEGRDVSSRLIRSLLSRRVEAILSSDKDGLSCRCSRGRACLSA